jgi:hypothetical protein
MLRIKRDMYNLLIHIWILIMAEENTFLNADSIYEEVEGEVW